MNILLSTITLANLNRFLQFLYRFNHEEILHATIIKFYHPIYVRTLPGKIKIYILPWFLKRSSVHVTASLSNLNRFQLYFRNRKKCTKQSMHFLIYYLKRKCC